jgi:hypothetical protein
VGVIQGGMAVPLMLPLLLHNPSDPGNPEPAATSSARAAPRSSASRNRSRTAAGLPEWLAHCSFRCNPWSGGVLAPDL